MSATKITTVAGEEVIYPAHRIRMVLKKTNGLATLELDTGAFVETQNQFDKIYENLRYVEVGGIISTEPA